MRELRFRYAMELRFSEPVQEHRFTLRCFPQSGPRQSIGPTALRLFPEVSVAWGGDGFGNVWAYGCVSPPHDRFSVEIAGSAVTGSAEREEALPPWREGRFRQQTALTRPGPAITAFHSALDLSGPPLERACAAMDALWRSFRYVPGSTDIHTTAEQAMAQGMGVCQDYAHILLSLCRLEGIPCRYAAGLLPGEGESHAWVDIYDGGCWTALDPTHDGRALDGYIRFSTGQDSAACSISRGIFRGFARQEQTIHAWVSEEEEL